MPVLFDLQENGALIVWTFIDPWTLPQLVLLYPKTEEIFNAADRADHTVHSLVDLRQARQIPSGVLRARQNANWNHPRSGVTVVIGANSLLKSLLEIVFRLSHFDRLIFCSSEEEARAYLKDLIQKESASQARVSEG